MGCRNRNLGFLISDEQSGIGLSYFEIRVSMLDEILVVLQPRNPLNGCRVNDKRVPAIIVNLDETIFNQLFDKLLCNPPVKVDRGHNPI